MTPAGDRTPGWQDVPRFGTPSDSTRLIVRPSAYGFLIDSDGRLAVVRSADGVFLPGGGIEEGETPEEAVARETLEECGFVIRVGECVCRAVQVAAVDECTLEKQSLFFEARIDGGSTTNAQPGHETIWAAPAVAARLLKHESQSWAVRSWMARAPGSPPSP